MFFTTPQQSDQLEGFRCEIREFCATQMPAEIRAQQARSIHLERHEFDAWYRCLGTKGWLTGKWPKEHGGLGWSPEQSLAFEEELGRAGAPPLNTHGSALAGPAIYTFGTQEQKRQHLPGIIHNEVWWCQGYSERGAGSDLASLKTRAVRDGDHYIVNGHKLWTSLAHWSDMMFALVRTDPDVKKQAGISFLLIDMKSPGITVRPIVGITLSHHLNEVFLDNVRVPVANRIGEENKGWTYAKFVLAGERVDSVNIYKYEHHLAKLRKLLATTCDGGQPLLDSPRFRHRLAELAVDLSTVKALLVDQLAAMKTGAAPPMMGAAALKLRGTELYQGILQTGIDVLARYGLAYQHEALLSEWNGELIGPDGTPDMIYEHLYRRAATIYGGTSEVQKNIIAKSALNL